MDTGKIRINKKRHFNKKYKQFPTKDPHTNLASTVNHELLHFKHPKAHEKTIRKIERKDAKNMSPKRKKQLLAALR